MKLRTWPVLAIAFGILLVLILLSGLATKRKAAELYSQFTELNRRHKEGNRTLNALRSDLHLSGVLVRDYLLDPSHITAEMYRQELFELRGSMSRRLNEMDRLVEGVDNAKIKELRSELDVYWRSFDPLFTWTPAQKASLSSFFLRREVMPRRNAVLEIASEIEDLSIQSVKNQELQLEDQEAEFDDYLKLVLLASSCLGLAVAAAGIARIKYLEHRSEEQHHRTERAEEEMRRLSLQLVESQEEERKKLSRELHDEVGQMLTGLRMELGKAERMRKVSDEKFEDHMNEAKRLAETIVRSVRDLAMGLRPSMLDDLGLGPALEWQAREFSRRYDVPVDVSITGDLDRLPESHRTCVYRIAQEALTNCARHSQATAILLNVHKHNGRIEMEVRDNGIGLPAGEMNKTGLGLRGMQERVRDLGGKIAISSRPREGTTLAVELPLAAGVEDEQTSNLTR